MEAQDRQGDPLVLGSTVYYGTTSMDYARVVAIRDSDVEARKGWPGWAIVTLLRPKARAKIVEMRANQVTSLDGAIRRAEELAEKLRQRRADALALTED